MSEADNTPQANQDSKLVGWLVSYALDSLGKAYEIRAGRSFISSERLPGQRVIRLPQKDISVLHLALNASPRHKVMVQDIFSAPGSYLTRSGQEQEQKIAGPVEIKHGDWLRLGSGARFQVCLIEGQRG